MTVIAVATVSGNDAEILCKCVALAAMANDCQVTITRVAGPAAIELPFIWPKDCPVQQLSAVDENLGEQLSTAIAHQYDGQTVLLDCPIEILAAHPDVWMNVDLLLVPVNPGRAILEASVPSLTRLLEIERSSTGSGRRIQLLDASASPHGKERCLSSLLQMVDEAECDLWSNSVGIMASIYRTPHWAELDDIFGLAPFSDANSAVQGIKDLWERIGLALDQQRGLDAQQQEPPIVRPVRQLADQLIDLAEDIRLIDLDIGPSSDELATACGLDEWRVLDDGRIEGRIVSPAGKRLERLAPSRAFRVDPEGRWVRTSLELLRLLKPAYPRASNI